MFDIKFFMNSHELRKQIMAGKKFKTTEEQEKLFFQLEQYRSKTPVAFNIETTNLCNMRCGFCPRTTLMTRKKERMTEETFRLIVEQLKPWKTKEWYVWEKFVEEEFGVCRDEMSQDHFYLYIIPKSLVIHGFGEPLLDKGIAKKVELCSRRDISTYFSCNPCNVSLQSARKLFDSGLNYIKFSVDSLDNTPVRGRKDTFSSTFEKIEQLVEMKEKNNYKNLTIVVSMIKLDNRNDGQWGHFERIFRDMGLYVYLKRQDQTWLDGSEMKERDIDWTQFCNSPWYSMTVKSNGDCVGCQEDYNNQIVFGNVNDEKLLDIWNNSLYNDFRMRHITSNAATVCKRPCDKRTIGEFIVG